MLRIYLLLAIVITLLTISCISVREEKVFDKEINNSSDCLVSKELKTYFPPKVFSDNPERNQFKTNWYTSYLSAMKEPSLYEMKKQVNVEMYRFLLLPSFSLPVMVRIQKCNNNYLIIAKELTGNRMKDPGIVKKQKRKNLSEQEWKHVVNSLDRLHFWELQTTVEEGVVADGIKWIVEGARDDKYHIVDRILPSVEFQKACLYLVKISELMNDEELLAFEKNINQ